jgi:hypothetical protein
LFKENQVDGLSVEQATYTFTEKAAYQVTVSGQPRAEGAFQPFMLRYSVRVERTVVDQLLWPEIPWQVPLFVAAAAIFFIFFVRNQLAYIEQRKHNKVHKGKPS